jgi:hypothetical protein
LFAGASVRLHFQASKAGVLRGISVYLQPIQLAETPTVLEISRSRAVGPVSKVLVNRHIDLGRQEPHASIGQTDLNPSGMSAFE